MKKLVLTLLLCPTLAFAASAQQCTNAARTLFESSFAHGFCSTFNVNMENDINGMVQWLEKNKCEVTLGQARIEKIMEEEKTKLKRWEISNFQSQQQAQQKATAYCKTDVARLKKEAKKYR